MLGRVVGTALAPTLAAVALGSPVVLKVRPSLHGDLAAVKFAFSLVVTPLSCFACSLTGVTPREVVKLPESICRKYKVPDGERAEIDKHPADVRNTMCSQDDKESWETEDQSKEDQGHDRCSSV